MNPIRIDINITLGATEALTGLLRAIVAQPAAVTAQEPAAPIAAPAEVEVQPSQTMECNDLPFDEPKEHQVEPAPAKEEPAPATEPKKSDKDVILEVIKRTRMRIQGEDFETNDSAENKKLGRMLTAEFKNIAMTLAATFGKQDQLLEKDKNGNDVVKPSRLPEIGAETAFARSCDELQLEGGKIVAKAPFKDGE